MDNWLPPRLPLAFTSVKAFGDLTITAASIRRLPKDARAQCSLLIGRHLVALCEVLAPDCRVDTLDFGEVGVPALFDLKRCGVFAGLRSAVRLQRAMAHALPDSTLVFDRVRRRERFVAGRRTAIGLPDAPNIYTAYHRFLVQAFPGVSLLPMLAPRATGQRIGLLPVSRVTAKNIPTALVGRIARQCREHGFEPVVLLLEGEELDPLPDLPRERVPRNFAALAQAIAGVNAVISADSLPAHLAAYEERPVFVASPVPNLYWLPASTLQEGHWGLFNAQEQLGISLSRFLHTLHRTDKP